VTNSVRDIFLRHNISPTKVKPLSGGDISQVLKVYSKHQSYVVKINTLFPFENMFQIEAKSLDILRESNSFIIPEVIAEGKHNNHQYIILEY